MKTICKNLRMLTAPNSGPMTFSGTNTYILGSGSDLCIIDPGPNDRQHYNNLLNLLKVETPSHILVTHSHLDHSESAKVLAQDFSIPILAHGNPADARSKFMKEILQNSKDIGGLEGLDQDFSPDYYVSDGEILEGNGWTIEILYTPGHLSDHLCFVYKEEDILFSGDLVMGWTSTLISPPDGDVGHYYSSLDKLLNRSEETYLPGHGEEIKNARAYVERLKKHRLERENQILTALAMGDASSLQIAYNLYQKLPEPIIRAGTRNVLAHLINLLERNLVTCAQPISPEALFSLSASKNHLDGS